MVIVCSHFSVATNTHIPVVHSITQCVNGECNTYLDIIVSLGVVLCAYLYKALSTHSSKVPLTYFTLYCTDTYC